MFKRLVLDVCYGGLAFNLIFGSFAFATDTSCSYMLEHSPKSSVVNSTAKYVVAGAVAGGLIGGLSNKHGGATNSNTATSAPSAIVKGLLGDLFDKHNNEQSDKHSNKHSGAKGAILGAIGGMAAGVAYSYYKNQEKLRTSPEVLAKQINYNYKAPYFRFEKIIIHGNTFSVGQYIPLIFRFDILKPKKHEGALVSYYATLYRENVPVSSFYDSITLPQGGVADVFAIPVCSDALPGNYTLYVRAVSSGIENVQEVTWHIR